MKILAAIDFSESSQKVVEQARELAKAFSAKLWLLHVAEPEPDFVGYEVETGVMREVIAKRFHNEHRQLQKLGQDLRDGGVDCIALLVQGPTVATILNQVEKLSIDMVVVGSHGKGFFMQLLVGSISEEVLHKVRVPVLVVPA